MTEVEFCAATVGDRRSSRRVIWMSLIWAGSLLAASFSIRAGVLPAGWVSWLVAAIPSVAGILTVAAYVRFLREADELQRLIQLQGLASGFGAGWIALCGYPLFERLGAPAAESSGFVVVMLVFWSLGMMVGWSRYR